MSTSQIKQRLREAESAWRTASKNPDRTGPPGFIQGVLRGFIEARRIIEQYHQEELNKALAGRRPRARWTAGQLLTACRRAYNRLKYSDRKGALAALKTVLDKIP